MSFPYFKDSDSERDSPSPYPPSTPSIDSDDERQSRSAATFGLRASIAALPEYRLREVISRLADSNTQFRRALQKEIAFLSEEFDTPPTTPTDAQGRPKSKRNSRTRKAQSCGRKLVASGRIRSEAKAEPLVPQDNTHIKGVYHPGRLEEEVYEFVSRTPNGAAFKVVQTVTMWSCCNEDEWSPGCISIAPPSPAATLGHRAAGVPTKRLTVDTRSLPFDGVCPDSELEAHGSDFLTPKALKRGRVLP